MEKVKAFLPRIIITFLHFSRKIFQTDLREIKSSEADCVDSGHFSEEDRTRYWLLEQGGGTVCRSCREGDIERRSSSIVQSVFRGERQKEEDCVKYKAEEEDCVKYKIDKEDGVQFIRADKTL